MKPIFFITRNFPPARGGIEAMAGEILKRACQGHKDSIILIHFGQERSTELPTGLRKYIHFPSKGMASTILMSSLTVFCLAFILRPGQIINMQVTTALGAYYACKFLHVPHRIVALGLEVLLWPEQPLFEWMKRRIFQNCFTTVSISHFTENRVLSYGLDPKKSIVIPPGTNMRFSHPPKLKNKSLFSQGIKNTDTVCLFAGRLVQRKGIDRCIEALKILEISHPSVFLVVAGTGPDEPRLKQMVEQLGLTQRIIFMGRVSDKKLRSFYSNADIFVMPSRTQSSPPACEGFGIVYLEAAAAGLPCIGSLQGGVPDAIVDGQTGFNIDPNDPKVLAEKISYLVENPSLGFLMGEKGKLRVQAEFSWDTLAPRFIRALFTSSEPPV